MATDASHQSLGNDGFQGGGHHERLESEIQQPGNSTRGRGRMEGRVDQVAGHGGMEGDIGRFMIADFPQQYDIRILAQNGAQYAGKVQPDAVLHRHLARHVDVELHGILNGDVIAFRRGVMLQEGVQGGGLATAGRPGCQYDALGFGHYVH